MGLGDPVKQLTTAGEDKQRQKSASKADGRQYSLKNDALDKLKREAEEKGATHILIQSEVFTLTPVNAVKLVGVFYQ